VVHGILIRMHEDFLKQKPLQKQWFRVVYARVINILKNDYTYETLPICLIPHLSLI